MDIKSILKKKITISRRVALCILIPLLIVLALATYRFRGPIVRQWFVIDWNSAYSQTHEETSAQPEPEPTDFFGKLAAAAFDRTKHGVTYDPAYVKIDYPGGDVPADRGVCTDVVIRSYRAQGMDLQVLVHKDMKANFSKYPQIWGLKGPNTNIDHRRVPNLMTFSNAKVPPCPFLLIRQNTNPEMLWPGTWVGVLPTSASCQTSCPVTAKGIR